MVADDTPAVQAVLKADTRRLKLLDEERTLQALLEKGEDSVTERLDKVGPQRPLESHLPLLVDGFFQSHVDCLVYYVARDYTSFLNKSNQALEGVLLELRLCG